jgi:hypothetical protein
MINPTLALPHLYEALALLSMSDIEVIPSNNKIPKISIADELFRINDAISSSSSPSILYGMAEDIRSAIIEIETVISMFTAGPEL